MRKNDSLRTERESLHVGVVSDMWLVVDQQKKDMGLAGIEPNGVTFIPRKLRSNCMCCVKHILKYI